MSGHSKWSQIKHKKGAADAKRGQLFGKLVKEITIAAREGGTNPDANPRLRSAVERAKAEGLPKDNIERAISRASGAGHDAQLFEITCEAAASGGVAIIIEAITDNKNRTVNEIKHILAEYGGKLAEPGALVWNFEKIGVIEVAGDQNVSKTRGEIENAIIESGARDFEETDGAWRIEMQFADLNAVRAALERAGIEVKDERHEYKPRAAIALLEQARGQAEKLLDALSDHDDVQEVHTNIRQEEVGGRW